jgi:hypothetical protein
MPLIQFLILLAITDSNKVEGFMLLISVHMVSIAKQSQLMHNIIVYLFIYLFIFFVQSSPLDNGIVTCRNMSGRR